MLELFLAKLFGSYMIIIGVLALARRKSLMPAVNDIVKNRALLLVLAALDIGAGLAVLIGFHEVGLTPAGVIALIGYVMLIEGILYLALPIASIKKMVHSFGNPAWYMASGLLSLLGGLYLAAYGFNFSL